MLNVKFPLLDDGSSVDDFMPPNKLSLDICRLCASPNRFFNDSLDVDVESGQLVFFTRIGFGVVRLIDAASDRIRARSEPVWSGLEEVDCVLIRSVYRLSVRDNQLMKVNKIEALQGPLARPYLSKSSNVYKV